MLRTRFCTLFDIQAPILQAAIWPATTPELVAEVSEAGGLGSIGAVFGSADSVRAQIERVRGFTERPFVVNHVVPLLDEDAFEVTLEARPAAVSFALGDPGGLVDRVHSVGAKAIHQVHTVGQAREAAQRGVDVLIAQGSEAGGQGMAAGVARWRSSPRSLTPLPRFPSSPPVAWRTAAAWPPPSCWAQPGPTWAPGFWLPTRQGPMWRGSSASPKSSQKMRCGLRPGARSCLPVKADMTSCLG
jgi:Nitronate monooxygenase